MSTQDIADEANFALDALDALGKAGKKEAKLRKRERELATKRQADIAYAARLARQHLQDEIDDHDHVLGQIDPDLPEPEPAVVPEPAAPVVVPEPTPAPVIEPVPVPAPVVVPEPTPAPTRVQTVVNDTNPTNWVGWVPWALAIVGLILGWAVVGEWLNQASQPVLWDWVAWLFKPIMAAVGFFGGGLIGHRLTQRQAAVRPAEA